MIVLIVFAAIIFYGTMFGYTYRTSLERAIAKHGCNDHCRADHITPTFFLSVAWPFGLPASFTMHAPSKDTKERKRREEEMTEAKHKVALAKLKADETEYLNRQLSEATK